MMRDLYGHFADVGRQAAGIALSLARVEQRRETETDRRRLARLAERFTRLSLGEVNGYDADGLLFAEIDGLFVVIKTLREFGGPFKADDVRGRAAEIAEMLRSTTVPAGYLRRFFREVHGIAWEIVTLGLHTNPIIEVFNALAPGLSDEQQLPSEITRAAEGEEAR